MTIPRACAGLAFLGALGVGNPALAAGEASSMPDAAAGQTIQVDMTNYEFTPSTLQLRANRPYRLELRNASHGDHSFGAPQLFAAARVAPADQSKVVNGEIEVDGGQTVDVNFTVTTPGTYKFHCTHFLHSAFGMTGEAVVQ